jgi:hypothetical protein
MWTRGSKPQDFEVMVYLTERHTIESEASRYDCVRRATAFFQAHLLRKRKSR